MKYGALLLPVFVPLALALQAPTRSHNALIFLAKEGTRLRSSRLTSLAEMLVEQPQGLDKVKDMIRHMLAQKLAAHAEDTTQKQFCNKELAGSEKKVKEYKDGLEKDQADFDMISAKLAELKESITDLHEDLAKAAKSVAEATALRQQEKEKFAQDKIQNQQNEEAMTKTMATIAENGGDRSAAEAAAEAAVKKRISDEGSEQERQMQYDKMMKELEVAKATKTKEVEYKERQVVSMQADISRHEQDIRMGKEELKAAQDYATTIKSQCVVPRESHKERQQRRQSEINSLKDAYGILAGEDIPVLG